MKVIYIDILFGINLVMDVMIFSIAANVLNKKKMNKRILIGSLMAAFLYCIGVYFPSLDRLPYYIYYISIPIIPIIYIFRPSNLKEFIKQYLISFGAAFIVGGATFNFYYLLSISMPKEEVTIILPLIVGGAVTGIVILSSKFIRERFILPQFEYRVTLINENKEKTLEGLVDTGNSLYTTLECKPVIVLAKENIEEVLSKQQLRVVERSEDIGVLNAIGEADGIKVYCIPFKSVGCEDGALLAVQIERMILTKGKYKEEFTDVVVGVCEEEVLTGWVYDVLLHPEFITDY